MKNHSRVFKMAHILHRDTPTHKWSSIVKYAWYFEQLRAWMQTGSVTFSYWKKDGSIREAHGTLNMNLIPTDKHPKANANANANASIFPYFDLDRQAWRSFDITKFIGFVTLNG